MLLAACTVKPQLQLIDSGCLAYRPIYVEPEDVDAISVELARQIVAHNRTGATRCNWGREPVEKEDGLL